MSDSEIDSDDLFVKIEPKKLKTCTLPEPTKITISVKESNKSYLKSVFDTDTLLKTFGVNKVIYYKNTKLSNLITFSDLGQISQSEFFNIEESEVVKSDEKNENCNYEDLKLYLADLDGKKWEVNINNSNKVKYLRTLTEKGNIKGFVLNGVMLDEEDVIENVLENEDLLDLVYL